ncbi:MAG: hypothetical protein ACR2NZ_08060 [Rubripirellula sp.]
MFQQSSLRSRRLAFETMERRDLLAAGLETYEWTETNGDAAWSARAGLQVVDLDERFYLMGGRTPLDPSAVPGPAPSQIWSDVWVSDDRGDTWEMLLSSNGENHWSPRAYFQAVNRGDEMFVLGGQDFVTIPNPNPFPAPGEPEFFSLSSFFSDVWSSTDGENWVQLTESAGWAGRAGLSSVVFNDELYVMGGSFNDDSAVIGGPPERVYLNDVWKSSDGVTWHEVTDAAPWTPRAGAQVVVKDDFMYLLGGEDGFTCDSGDRCPPYYNDVWRTGNGKDWELVTETAQWASRPGHQVQVVLDQFVLFGGFGLSADPSDPFRPSNPMDIWTSKDGANWVQISDSPWNADSPSEVKYDFDTVVVWDDDQFQPDIYTFGGDRETFDFTDPFNYLNIDNDVWRFSPSVDQGPVFASGGDLYAIGTTGRDKISFYGSPQATRVKVNKESFGPFNVSGDLISFGREGNDSIRAGHSIRSSVELHGGQGNDRLVGSRLDDRLFGDDGRDVIFAGRGDDFASGGLGRDRLVGGSDDDTLLGGPGADVLIAGFGDDILIGGMGDDYLNGSVGRNLLIGGLGRDVLLSSWRGESILIGGTTVYDSYLNALSAVLDEWSDRSRTFEDRVSNLTDGSGSSPRANGQFFLVSQPNDAAASTVLDDESVDYLVGGCHGGNWYFEADLDRIIRPRGR